ncbi:MAG: MBOAT family protein [Planctomycetes bacterium]|nr:MBOAT family protein [Planctomycetota bacterium]
MLFNSRVFLVFFVIVYVSYLLLKKRWRVQNAMLLVASYIFYGWWDWRFLSLIFISTVIDYIAGLNIIKANNPSRRKLFLVLSCITNLGLLGVFKYFDFFIGSATELLNFLNVDASRLYLHVTLPVGISFYTFQTMSYTIDIYRGRLKPTRNFWDFALFVSFFPQLVAGPIERAIHLLPQISGPRRITPELIRSGIFLVIWGLFKKVFIADNCMVIVNEVFANHPDYGGLAYLAAIYAFAVQIFCDFSGYSDIARGISMLMGFDLMLNFNLPYFAVSPSDLWRRWHISLSSWLRDYLYISLGGNRGGVYKTYRNLMLTMLLGGLWHGAKWTMVLWGFYHGLLLVVQRLLSGVMSGSPDKDQEPTGLRKWLQIILMFHLTCFGWLLFRAVDMPQVWDMLVGMCTSFKLTSMELQILYHTLALSSPLILMQFCQYLSGDLLIFLRWRPTTKWAFLLVMSALVFITINLFAIGVSDANVFIYFQF